jgi:N-acetyltransferase
MNNFFNQQLILEDNAVRLEPLQPQHFEQLLPAAMHNDLWTFTINKIYSTEDFKQYFNTALEEKLAQKSYAFAVYDKQQ